MCLPVCVRTTPEKTIKILALLNTAPPSEKYGTAYFCNFDEIIWLLKCDSYADF